MSANRVLQHPAARPPIELSPSELKLRPPSALLAALEARAVAEIGWFFQALPLLRRLPRGDGHPVLVLPGFLASDRSTFLLRRFLRSKGYEAHAWRQGRNLGLRPGLELGMIRRLRSLHWRYGAKVSLVGWSLGGIYSRELARQHPEHVRQVITLGSPFNLSSRANHAWRIYELLSKEDLEVAEEMLEALRAPLEVPSTAVYSKTDGVVAWQTCVDHVSPSAENVEVYGSHCGLGHNPMAIAVIADRLKQPEGVWRPFERRGVRRLLFRRPVLGPHEGLESQLGDAALI
ncbi:MAG: alpha/beta hydrolase [Acidobacteriota bacterium]